VIKVHIEWQHRYSNDLVRPLARGVIRDAISQFGVEEVYSSKRDELSVQISDVMREKLKDNGIMMADFILRNITFSPEYAASVEKKQVAEQEAQQAFYIVEQRKQEAEQARQVAQGRADAVVIEAEGAAEARIIQAEAESESLLVISTAVASNPDLIQYLYINKINPGIQTMLLPSEGLNYFYPLPTAGPPASLAPEPTPEPSPTPTPLPTPEPTPTP
jgi:regulator of protease activity HflC (stomatin/prohibitin superfamily)